MIAVLALAGALAAIPVAPAAAPAAADPSTSPRTAQPSPQPAPQTATPPATQEADSSEDLDPTKLVFLNLRYQHDELGDGDAVDFLLLRRDVAIERPRSWAPGVRLALLRFDLPVGNVYLNGTSTDGIGDLFTQALHVRQLGPGWSIATGLALQIPTATADLLGTGKWVVAPLVVPIWRPSRRTLFFTKVQNYASFAGDDDRRDVHHFAVTPTYIRTFGRKFLLLDSEGDVDWERDNEVRWKSGLLVGTALRHQRAVWVKLEVPWGEHRVGEWALRASIVFRRR